MIRTAVIGLGNISRVHIAGIKAFANAEFVAVCDIDPARNTLPGVPFYTDYMEMLREAAPDVAHICLPHYLHYPVAEKLAEAGCNIFAEKPLALNGDEASRYALLEKRYGVKICLCLQNRCNSSSRKLRKLLQSGEYGRVTGIRGVMTWNRSKAYYAESPWRGSMELAGGGCMINQAIHTLDLMQYFADSPIKSIKGSITQLLDYGLDVEDTASAKIAFENGAAGLFSATVAGYEDHSVELDVCCERASFHICDGKLTMRQGEEQTLLASDGNAYSGKKCYGNSHSMLIHHFYQALEQGRGWYIPPGEGVTVMRMIDAIRESSDTGKTIML